MSRPPPPPSTTHSSFICPNSSHADNISTAADVDAVACSRSTQEEGRRNARSPPNQLANQEGVAFILPNSKDERCVVMDFSQNGDVPGLKEQPGPTSTYYYNTSTYYYYPSGHGKNCSGSIKKSLS